MEFDNSLLTFWYDSWLVILGFAAALVVAVLVAFRTSWRTTGDLLLKSILGVALLVALPVIIRKLTPGAAVTADTLTTVYGWLSIVGVAAALAVGVSYLVVTAVRAGRWAEAEPEGIVTPAEGVPLMPEAEEFTRTLGSEAAVAPGMGAADITGAGVAPAAAPTQAPAAWLVFKSGPRTGQSIPLDPEATRIGRGSDNDLVVDDPAVSRRHATIAFQGGTYVVEDAGSSSGTLVEGSTAARTVLVSGSSVQVGETELVFMQAEGTAAPAPAAAARPGAERPGETVIMEQPSAVLAWLAVTAGPNKGKTYQLKEGDTTIGRGQENDVAIADAAVSRRHALVKHQEGKSLLLDLGSSSGTKVNRQPISGKALCTGGVISVGQTQLFMVDVEAQEEAAIPAAAEGATMVAQPEAGGGILIARSGPDAGKSFTMVQGENAIGRDPECQILLTDPAVSRRHAMVRRQGDSCIVYDMGSRTGTRVDGETLIGRDLSAGDVISIGRTEIVLMQPEQPKR
ncbi:FHA domain-containing protein [Chloroflexota bacterium]